MVSVNRPTASDVSAAEARPLRTVPIVVFGLSLSSFLMISYVLCIIGYLLFPGLPIAHSGLIIFLPGFTLLSWPSFF